MDIPITEARNPVTTTIDVASTDDIVQMLHMCDREIFNGWKQYKGLFHPETIATIRQISEVAVDILKKPGGMIVLSGCGTSGRIAFLIARNFNEVLRNSGREQCFRYLIAGRDKALFTSQEAPEDDPQCGIEMLKEVTAGRNRVLFIGITCGLSAPFVAGQLYYCMENLNIYTPVLLGFNPCNLARNIKIEKWDKTFLQVVRLMENKVAENKAYILNPVVGMPFGFITITAPEQITGSSRMKSGTATKILLETIFVSCVKAYENIPSNIEAHLKSYQDLCEVVYKETSSISKLVQLAGNSLKAGGTISYIGWDSLGVMGMIDASECPPTYGASLSDIRGFVETGYKLLNNIEGDLSPLGKYYRISIDEFQSDVVPGLKESDLVILLMKDESCSVSDILWKSTCKKACISFSSAEKIQEERLDCTVSIDLSNLITEPLGYQHYKSWGQLYKELSTKWILNAVTTGAHILKGKVYQNIMVDLKVSNNKLFFRAVGIIQNFSNLPKEVCQEYLLKSIYMTDDLSDDLKSLQVKDHIVKATTMEKVVPTALVAAILKCNIDDARKLLLQHHVIRTAISDIINNRTTV